jgi:hypothetical protein
MSFLKLFSIQIIWLVGRSNSNYGVSVPFLDDQSSKRNLSSKKRKFEILGLKKSFL